MVHHAGVDRDALDDAGNRVVSLVGRQRARTRNLRAIARDALHDGRIVAL